MNPASSGDRLPFWLFPNAWSLDAPLIALLWQALLAQATGIPLRFPAQVALGLTVWAIYIADRLLDVRGEAAPGESLRHRFYRRHQRAAAWLLGGIAAVDGVWIGYHVRPEVFRSAIGPGFAVLGYLLYVHRRGARPGLPKQLLAAALFTAGTFVAAWAGAAYPLAQLAVSGLLFFGVCLANLVLIESWEYGLNTPRETALVRRHLIPWTAILGIGAYLSGTGAWGLAICGSLAILQALSALDSRVTPPARAALADAALLTPLLYVWR